MTPKWASIIGDLDFIGNCMQVLSDKMFERVREKKKKFCAIYRCLAHVSPVKYDSLSKLYNW